MAGVSVSLSRLLIFAMTLNNGLRSADDFIFGIYKKT